MGIRRLDLSTHPGSPNCGIVLDSYRRPEDLNKYLKAIINMGADTIINKRKYKAYSSSYRQNIYGGAFYLILEGDEKYIITNYRLYKLDQV